MHRVGTVHSPVDRVHRFSHAKLIPENPIFLFSLEKFRGASGNSNLYNFSTTTPNSEILSPKFSGSLPLSFYAFI
jgi:hypothetical protein